MVDTVVDMQRKTLSVKDAAAVMGVSEDTVRGMLDRRELAYLRIGNRNGGIRIRPQDIDAYLERQLIPALVEDQGVSDTAPTSTPTQPHTRPTGRRTISGGVNPIRPVAWR
jgi:excisionase family DNA binding protein